MVRDCPALLARLGQEPPADLVLVPFPEGDGTDSGLDVLRQLRARDAEVPIVAVAERGDVDAATKVVMAGATDLFVCGDRLHERVATLIDKIRRVAALVRQNRALHEQNARLREIRARPLPSGRRLTRDAGGPADCRARRRDPAPRADCRRARDRQGTRGAGDSCRVGPRGPAVCRDQLRRLSRDTARERAVWPRARRLHGGRSADARPVRAGQRRHAVPRRDLAHAAGVPAEDPARRRVPAVSPASAERTTSPSTSGCWQRPTPT